MIYTINNLFINSNDKTKKIPTQVTVNGWVRSNRNSKKVGFLDLNDGSSINNLQVVYDPNLENNNNLTNVTTGSAVTITGNLILTPNAKQPFELKVITATVYNICANDYPIQKKNIQMNFFVNTHTYVFVLILSCHYLEFVIKYHDLFINFSMIINLFTYIVLLLQLMMLKVLVKILLLLL